jgi:solute carrier family 25 phosphate transporter 23/24/25/41
MDKSGSGKVTFEEWRDFLLLLPRPASMGNVWKYWTSYTSPRLATSIANQDLDVILAEKPVLPPTGLSSSTSLPLSSSSSFSSAGTKLAGKQKVPSSAAISSSNPEDQDSSPVAKDDTEAEGDENQPIFAGSGAYLLAGGLAGAGESNTAFFMLLLAETLCICLSNSFTHCNSAL